MTKHTHWNQHEDDMSVKEFLPNTDIDPTFDPIAAPHQVHHIPPMLDAIGYIPYHSEFFYRS